MGHLKGIFLIVSGSMLWGATGPLIEWILSSTGMSVPFMLTVRLVTAGLMILLFMLATKKNIFLIWKSRYWSRELIVFGIFGMLGIQYSFVATIDASNAVFATLLQFLGPIFIVVFIALKMKMYPPKYQTLGIVGTFFGLFLLLTNATFEQLLVSEKALIWGLILGVTFAIYTLYPVNLMKEWGVLVVVGWAMLIGGVMLGISTSIWNSNEWGLLYNVETSSYMLVLIFFGTIAFILFLASMKFISPVLTSILSSVEPLTAMIISMIVFHTKLGVWQLFGIFIMIVCVTWLSIAGGKAEKYKSE